MNNNNINIIDKPKKTRYETCKASILRYQKKNREMFQKHNKNRDWDDVKKSIYKYRESHKDQFNDYMSKYYKRKRLEKKIVLFMFKKLKIFILKTSPKIIELLKKFIIIIDESF